MTSLWLAADASSRENGTAEPPSDLPAFVIQLDQKFFAELSHMAASYNELFSQSGRQKLVQVNLHFPATFSSLRLGLGAGTLICLTKTLRSICRSIQGKSVPVMDCTNSVDVCSMRV